MASRGRRSRGHIEARPDRGNFRTVVYAGVDPLTSKARYLRKTAATRQQAEVELTRLLRQVDEQRHPRSKVTVGQLVDKWLEVAELEATTRQRYEGLLALHIRPTFGATPAEKLDAELLERYYARLRRCTRLCSGKARDHTCRPLSSSSVRQIHFMLRAAFDRGVRWRYLSVNEASRAEPPAFERKDPDPPSAEEVADLLNAAAHDSEWHMFLWLTMVTGCRRGEVCALRWTDVDLTRGILTVERSIAQTRDGAAEKRTKTRQKRRVALDNYTLELLNAHRERCEQGCAELDGSLPRGSFIFSRSPDGLSAMLPSTMTQKYRRLAITKGLRSTAHPGIPWVRG